MREGELTEEEHPFTSVVVIENASVHRAYPHCGAERIVKKGTAEGWQRFKCRACTHTFNALTCTLLALVSMDTTAPSGKNG